MRSATGLFVCLIGLATVSTNGWAQQQPGATQPPRTFQSGVDVVEVDVSVLDKDRRPVRGLAQPNFTILEDGKPRPIVAFSAVDLPERDASSARALWVRDVSSDVVTNAIRPEGRLVVIMLDWSIRFEDHLLANRIATAAVNSLGPDGSGRRCLLERLRECRHAAELHGRSVPAPGVDQSAVGRRPPQPAVRARRRSA
jgi:hypothetical protein